MQISVVMQHSLTAVWHEGRVPTPMGPEPVEAPWITVAISKQPQVVRRTYILWLAGTRLQGACHLSFPKCVLVYYLTVSKPVVTQGQYTSLIGMWYTMVCDEGAEVI